MKLIITKIGDFTQKEEIKVNGIELNIIDNELIYVPKNNPNIIRKVKMQTNYRYSISKN